jgi:hypothetical protein
MRLFKPPMRFWTITTIIAAVLGAVVFLWIWDYAENDQALRKDVLKTLLQFLVITVAGGILGIFLNARRDEDQRDAAREAAVREMVEQIGTAYRKLKMVKRRLRSQMLSQNRGPDRARDLPYRIPAPAFEKAMDDLLIAQIEAEQVRDRVLARSDLLSRERIIRVHAALNYAARYFHDVYEDFEDCAVSRRDEHYEITSGCRGLADFLGRTRWKTGAMSAWCEAMETQYKILKDDSKSPEERYEALGEIVALRSRNRELPRYRLVATQCIALASADVQRALRRRRWRTLFARGKAWLD